MEASSAAGQEAGASAAETPSASGSGPGAAAAEAIDLSLDDIIKNNKKGQPKPRGRQWRQPFTNENPSYNSRRPGFRNWGPRNLQGLNRFRAGFGKQQFYKKRFWNWGARPGQHPPVGPSGRSPLNRPASAQQGKLQDATADEGGAAADTPQGPPPRAKQFGIPGGPPPGQSNRPFRRNQRPPFFQRQPRFNFGLRQFSAERRPPRRQWWRPQASPGAVMTVSVSNFEATQANTPGGAKRPFLRGRGPPTQANRRQPKGVPLRFNFHTMATQTSLTLNERFSGLRKQRRFPAQRNTERMVTLP